MTDAVFPDRLTQLRNRWEADPSSRIFLQLAEEYRHLGRVREALDVLDRGLKEHPGYLSALVAKGRCHLELSEGEAARGVLERVVKQDATQMVANKLLVRAYLETGDPAKAQERLDLYSLLNDSDPEIDELRRRIKQMARPPAEGARPMEADPFALQPAEPAGRSRQAADIFDLGLPGPRRKVDDVFALGEKPVPAPAAAAAPLAPEPEPVPVMAGAAVAEAEEAGGEEGDGDLFPGLATRDRRRRYLQGLAAEGLFALDLFGEPAPLPAPAPPPPLEEPSWLEEVAAAAAPAAEPAAPELFELPPFELPPLPPVPDEELWSEEAEALEATPEPAEAPPAPAAAESAAETATLGELYLRQGHLQEAERIFREVLEREPGNAAARAGLEQLAGQPPALQQVPPLDARQLLAGYHPGAQDAGPAAVRSRKIHLLHRYLDRLRGRGSHVS